jgi:hypothetical protein
MLRRQRVYWHNYINFAGLYFTECNHLGDLGIDWRIILKTILKKQADIRVWSGEAQVMDQWRVLENTAMKLLVPECEKILDQLLKKSSVP